MSFSTELAPSHFKFVEHELYDYRRNKRKLKELSAEIAESSIGNIDYTAVMTTGSVGSATEAAAMDIITNTVALRTAETVQAIENTIRDLKKEKQEEKVELFQKKYIQRKPWQQIVQELPISRRTYFRYRKEIVHKAGAEMGLCTT